MKKFLLAAGGIILSFNMFAATPPVPTNPGAGVYVGQVYEGAARFVNILGRSGDNDLAGTPFQDSIKSAIVGPRTCLMLHQDSQFTGGTLFLTEGAHGDLGIYGASNITSSVQAFDLGPGDRCDEDGVARLYVDSNERGRFARVAPRHRSTTNDFGSIGNMNDQISSLYVPSGYCLVVWNDNTIGDFRLGRTVFKKFGPGYWDNLSLYGFNDVISEYHLEELRNHPDCYPWASPSSSGSDVPPSDNGNQQQ